MQRSRPWKAFLHTWWLYNARFRSVSHKTGQFFPRSAFCIHLFIYFLYTGHNGKRTLWTGPVWTWSVVGHQHHHHTSISWKSNYTHFCSLPPPMFPWHGVKLLMRFLSSLRLCSEVLAHKYAITETDELCYFCLAAILWRLYVIIRLRN